MEITVEISYYALADDYTKPVGEFLNLLEACSGVTISTGIMSTVITGGYDEVMDMLSSSLKPMMNKYPSVFTLKIANACKACTF
jgi:uncharacterized protein YqgV (UPF0045/DUF77 family)